MRRIESRDAQWLKTQRPLGSETTLVKIARSNRVVRVGNRNTVVAVLPSCHRHGRYDDDVDSFDDDDNDDGAKRETILVRY